MKDHLIWRLQQPTYREALMLKDTLLIMANIDGAKHTRKEGLCSMCIWILNLVGLCQNFNYCDTIKVSAHGDDSDALHLHYTEMLNEAFELNTTGFTFMDEDNNRHHIPVKVQFCCNGKGEQVMFGAMGSRGRFPVLRDMCSRDDLNDPYLVWAVTGDTMSSLATVAKLQKEFATGVKRRHLTDAEVEALLLVTFGGGVRALPGSRHQCIS